MYKVFASHSGRLSPCRFSGWFIVSSLLLGLIEPVARLRKKSRISSCSLLRTIYGAEQSYEIDFQRVARCLDIKPIDKLYILIIGADVSTVRRVAYVGI